MRFQFLFILALVFSLAVFAMVQPAGYPSPPPHTNQLFYLQRTHNTNTIVYDLNYENGRLHTDEPIHAYWIRYQEKGQKEELSYIQRKFAYGVKSRKITDKEYELNIVAYKKMKMYLKHGADGKFHVFTNINKKPSILTSIYLEMKKGGSFWSPDIEYVDVTGIDPDTNQPVKERIKI
ncbi:MAG: DUF4833 domain-containing protein [Chitinophagaceae bacterium]|nr:DUF4833 domain-containing protein [Chitinophagaceae bacterium]